MSKKTKQNLHLLKISPQEKKALHDWWPKNLKGVAQRTPRERFKKDNPGTLPIAAYAKEPPSIELSSSDENGDDELVFSPIPTSRGEGSFMHLLPTLNGSNCSYVALGT